MKLRIMALIFAAALLLAGCGGQETPAAEVTAAPTEAPTVAVITEPTEEPTTVPTEPPTVVEQLGYSLWEGADQVLPIDGWRKDGAEMPISEGISGHYENMPMQFAIVGSNGKEYREAVKTVVDVQMYAFPGEHFGENISWLRESLEPFSEADAGAYEGWIAENQDKKLIYAEIIQQIQGTDLYLRTIADGIKMKDLRVGYTLPDLVDAGTGAMFSVTEKYDAWNPEVGSWSIAREDGEITVQAWYTENFSWDVQEGSKAGLSIVHEMYILVPGDYEDLNICMGEYATGEAVPRFVISDDGKSKWASGNIADDAFAQCEDYIFRFFGFDMAS